MKKDHLIPLIIILLLNIFNTAVAQKGKVVFGPKSDNAFVLDAAASQRLYDHKFVPVSNSKVTSYDEFGKEYKTDSLVLDSVYTGKFNGRPDTWILYHYVLYRQPRYLYVQFNKMKDLGLSIGPESNSYKQKKEVNEKEALRILIIVLIPFLLLLISTLYYFRRFFRKVVICFNKVSEQRFSAALGLVFMVPFFVLTYSMSSILGGAAGDAFSWMFSAYGANKAYIQELPMDYNITTAIYAHAALILILITIFSLIWIGLGFAINGIVHFFTKGSPEIHHKESYDGGITYTTTYISPATDPLDVNFKKVMLYWLIYSIVFVFSYMVSATILGYNFWHPWRHWILTAAIMLALSLIYYFIIRKKIWLNKFLVTLATSFLGFAVSSILLMALLALIKAIIKYWG